MKQTLPSLTVGIPTYYGGPSLVETVKSLRRSKGIGQFRLIVTVDGNPLDREILRQLKKRGVEVIENKDRVGQMARIKQLISLCTSDILVTTQDDIIFSPNTLALIQQAFMRDSDLTMVGPRLKALKPTSLFEKALQVGMDITYFASRQWKKGDNYLLASGRCLAYRTKAVKQFTIPSEVINSDALMYFENKRQGGNFKHLPSACVFNKLPQRLSEHLKQSGRFQDSHKELSFFFTVPYESEYLLPKRFALQATLKYLMKQPIQTCAFLSFLAISRLQPRKPLKKPTGIWKTDLSTKRA